MKKGTHGKDEKKFEELTYASQAKTLNAQILGLSRGIKAHLKYGISIDKDISEVKRKYKAQLIKIIEDLD